VDVTPVSMVTIWSIITDKAFLVNNMNIHTIIASNLIEKLCLFFLHLFHLVERMAHHKFGKNRTEVKVTKNTNSFFTKVGITYEPIIIETSNWHQHISNSTHYHMGRVYLTLAQLPFQALEVDHF
jgi:hypothetical protein